MSAMAQLTDADLIGRLIDGPADAECQHELARRISADRGLAIVLRRHLWIAECAEQQALPERSGANFTAGWRVRVAAEDDAAVFTARTVLRLVAADADRHTERVVALVRLGGLAAAAGLLIGLGWASSLTIKLGRHWYGLVSQETTAQLAGTPYAQRGNELRNLLETLR
jgi:hypothetical protein